MACLVALLKESEALERDAIERCISAGRADAMARTTQ